MSSDTRRYVCFREHSARYNLFWPRATQEGYVSSSGRPESRQESCPESQERGASPSPWQRLDYQCRALAASVLSYQKMGRFKAQSLRASCQALASEVPVALCQAGTLALGPALGPADLKRRKCRLPLFWGGHGANAESRQVEIADLSLCVVLLGCLASSLRHPHLRSSHAPHAQARSTT